MAASDIRHKATSGRRQYGADRMSGTRRDFLLQVSAAGGYRATYLTMQAMGLLGATAAQAVMGPAFRVSKQRGEIMPSPLGIPVLATVHPSSILRATDDASRESAMDSFIADLKVAAAYR